MMFLSRNEGDRLLEIQRNMHLV